MLDICRGRKYEFCRIVPRTSDGTVVFPKCAEDGEWDPDSLLFITPMQVYRLQQRTG